MGYPHPIINHTDSLRRARARLALIDCRASEALRASMPKEERPCGASLSLEHQRAEAVAARHNDLVDMKDKRHQVAESKTPARWRQRENGNEASTPAVTHWPLSKESQPQVQIKSRKDSGEIIDAG